MAFIYKNQNIKERRVKILIDTLYKSLTDLMILEDQAQSLIDEPTQIAYIQSLAQNPGDSLPILPFGTELVLNWKTLGFDFVSDSKFIDMVFNAVTANYDRDRLNILELDYKTPGEVLPSGTVSLTTSGLKLKNGQVVLKNLEKYDYDFESYGLLNELYRALKIFLDSVESFYAQFYQQSVFDFVDTPYNSYDDSAADDRVILVYDTRAMDAEITNVIEPATLLINDPTDREAVLLRYLELRDAIKNFTMFTCVTRLEQDITDLLFCINGSKKYHISQNIELQALDVRQDVYGYNRTYKSAEEVFFPFHNKAILDSFSQGLASVW